MSDSDDLKSSADFLHFYQILKFQENTTNKITDARIKRMQLISNNLECSKWGDRAASSYLTEYCIKEYFEVIDERNGINNYADYIKALCSKLPKPVTKCCEWKSNIKNSNKVNAIVKDLNLNMKSIDEKMVDDYILQKMKLSINKKVNLDKIRNESKRIPSVHVDLQDEQSSSSLKKNVSSFTRDERQGPTTFHSKENMNQFSTHQKSPILKQADKEEIIGNSFKTARTELKIQTLKKYGGRYTEVSLPKETVCVKRSLGSRSRSVNSKFIPPIKNIDVPEDTNNAYSVDENYTENERLKNLDPKMIELIKNEIMDHGNPITWDDISGLEFAKNTIQEIVVWPLLRPDIFTGLRRPPKGILLFGPPGTGKTLIGKCIASQSSSTFFSISASSLTSKWIGESEKLVRTLFAVARCHQPAVIFIDEIDSLLSQRNDTEHESSRRIKTEFLVQLDGATTHEDDRILVIGATNRPQELDEAARRRLVKRLYIPLPDVDARSQIVQRLIRTEKNDLTEENIDEIARLTDGYSGADMKNLCQEASLGPIRCIDFRHINSIESQEVRPVTFDDFKAALKVVRSSVSPRDLNQYLEWDKIYGSKGT